MSASKKIFVVLFILASMQSYAQWNADPTINTPVCTTVGTQQMLPQMIADENGGLIITWMETTLDMTSSRIFAQHISSTGTKLWAAGGVEISGGSGLLTNPQIAGDANGGAVISWVNLAGGVVKHYMQRVAATGQTQWTSGGVLVCNAAVSPIVYYQLIGDGLGGASLLWNDTRGGNNQVYAQHVDGAGNLVWPAAGLAVTPPFTFISGFDAAPDANGGMFLCFFLNSGLLNLHEIYVQHINADGIAVWGNSGKNLSNVPSDQLYCRIAKDTNDHVIVVWQDFRLDPAWSQIFGQRIDSSGNLQWGPNGKLLADSVAPTSTVTKIVADSKKGAIVAWLDKFIADQTTTAHLFGVRVDSTGTPVWIKKELATWEELQLPNDFELASDFKGGCYISFAKVQPYGLDPAYDVYDLGAQHIFPDGSLEHPLAGMPVCSLPMTQYYQQLVCDSSGLAVVVWADLRSMAEYDLYAMRIGTASTLPVTWVHFLGKLLGTSVSLSWRTAHEVNNKGFTIQRSSNGNQFDSIGFTLASNAESGALYSFEDMHPLTGHNYYRLQQTDIDGKISYSRVIRVDVGMENIVRLYPNPAHEKIIVSGAKPGSRLVIYDAGGRMWKQVVGTGNVQEIYIYDLPKGMYYLADKEMIISFIKK